MRAATNSFPFHRRLRIESLEDRRLLALMTVDTLNDTVDFGDGVTSLREAIFATNLVGGADTIEFAASLTIGGPATITLRQGELAITDALAINGPGANMLTIDASGNDGTPDSTLQDGDNFNDRDGSRVFNIDDVNSGNLLNVSISGLTLAGGDVNGDGGAIRNRENLTVAGSTISGNFASGSTSSDGGAIYNAGNLTVTASTISGNSASGNGGAIRTIGSNSLVLVADSTLSGNAAAVDGGAISNSSSSVTVINSTLSGNSANGSAGSDGGAISTSSGSLIVTDSAISNNSALGAGGGVWRSSGSVTVTGSTISGNSATGATNGNGGGIRSSSGDLTVTDSTISGNSASRDGGGIYMSSSSTLTVTNSTIGGNTAARDGAGIWKGSSGLLIVTGSTLSGNTATSEGGGIYTRANLTMTNSTLSGNRATSGSGGGLHLFGTVASTFTIRHSTIVSNSGSFGGGAFLVGGTLTLDHLILASNTAAVGPDLTRLIDAVVSSRFSLIGSNASSGLAEAPLGAPDANGNLIGGPAQGVINPLLGPLADNGGPTLTYALLTGSPALDAGDSAAAGSAPEFDQRGAPFTRIFDGDGDGGARIDIGAYENRPLTFVVDTLADESDGDFSTGDFSLRETIVLANGSTNPEDDIIKFADALTSGGQATIVLMLGELAVSDSMRIVGPGAERLVIDANDPTPAHNGDGSRVFNVDDANSDNLIDVSISGLTLTGGDVGGGYGDSGGAIRSAENLRIINSTICGNSAFQGGGIGGFNLDHTPAGNLIVIGSTISNNAGGGIESLLASLTVTGSTISANSGAGFGGIAGGIVTVANSTISDNSGFDGGIYGSHVTVTDSMISGNRGTSSGGIRGRGTISNSTISGNVGVFGGGISGFWLTVIDSTISGNSASARGGGIYCQYGLTVTGCTISGNFAGNGGGIATNTNLTTQVTLVANSTISGNTASDRGGGIYNLDGLTIIRFSTITGNLAPAGGGGGVASFGNANTRTQIESTIVAGNMQSDVDFFLGAVNPFASLGYNLIGAGNAIGSFSPASGDLIGVSPLLGPLADNGGPTFTHALLPSSPAIDAGDPNFAPPPDYDQRGAPFARVLDGNGVDGLRIDMGTFEAPTVPPQLPGDYNLDESVDAADYVMWRKLVGTPDLDPYELADGDGDTIIGPEDYGVWTENFGETLEPGSGGAEQVESVESGVASIASSVEIQELSADAPAVRNIATDYIGEPIVQMPIETLSAPAEIDAAAARSASFAALDTRSNWHNSSTRSRGRIDRYRVAESANEDLMLLAIDRLERFSSHDVDVQDQRGRGDGKSDDEESRWVIDESPTEALAGWR